MGLPWVEGETYRVKHVRRGWFHCRVIRMAGDEVEVVLLAGAEGVPVGWAVGDWVRLREHNVESVEAEP